MAAHGPSRHRLSNGDAPSALVDLEPARQYVLGGAGTKINNLYPAYIRGEAYLAAQKPEAAKLEFQKLFDHPGIVLNFVTGAVVPIQMARAMARIGDFEGARKSYQEAFALWQHADEGLLPYGSPARSIHSFPETLMNCTPGADTFVPAFQSVLRANNGLSTISTTLLLPRASTTP